MAGWGTGELELTLAARGLSLGMRCSSTNLRNKWTSLISKLLKRVVVSLRAAVVRRKAGAPSLGPAAVLTAEALADEQGAHGSGADQMLNPEA